MNIQKYIRDIPDFPRKGILFKDITPLLAHPNALKAAIRGMAEPFHEHRPDLVIGVESRGFIFGPAVATHLGCGFAPVRKPGKLPHTTESHSYELEYGKDTLEIHVDAAKPGDRILIVDDLVATGGTAEAAAKLAEKLGAQVIGYSFLIELTFLQGRLKLGDPPIHALLTY